MRATDVAWAAGLFEGEGSFCCYRVRNGVYLRVSLQTTDRDVLERFAEIVACGKITQIRPDPRRPDAKTIFQWQAYGDDHFRDILTLFEDQLGQRRKQRAHELLSMPRPQTRRCPQQEVLV